MIGRTRRGENKEEEYEDEEEEGEEEENKKKGDTIIIRRKRWRETIRGRTKKARGRDEWEEEEEEEDEDEGEEYYRRRRLRRKIAGICHDLGSDVPRCAERVTSTRLRNVQSRPAAWTADCRARCERGGAAG